MTLVTVIIPARNEEASLGAALRSILEQSMPLDSIEVVVVDGASADNTPIVAKQALDGSEVRRWAVLTNPSATTPSNLNLGLDWAAGDVVVRIDARSTLPRDYIERALVVLDDPSIAVLGGRQVADADGKGPVAQSIARALNNPFANGGARYRDHRATSGPCDTAYLGVFRTGQLRSAGGWNAEFSSNQDFELSRRMSRFGLVWYEAGLPVLYQPRSTYRDLFGQYRRFGRWKARYWRSTGDRPRPRQIVLLAAPALALIGAAAMTTAAPAIATRAAVGGSAALLAIDHGGQERTAPLRHRLGSCVAMALIGLGWWTGAVQQMISRESTSHER